MASQKIDVEMYLVSVIIENKPYINDPEGETILKDLIAKGGYSSVKKVRMAKMLNITLEAKDRKDAEDTVRKLCDELRIYNPVVSNCKIECLGTVQVKN
jgi:phosphoribosylformylglycinamidine synthase